jgi:hypothetical protein
VKAVGDIVPRNVVVGQGIRGIAGVGGGIALLILNGISSAGFLPGLIVGVVVVIAGLVLRSSREDRRAGAVTSGVGAATILASIPAIRHALGWLMPTAGIALILAGLWSLIKFWRNLRRRSG